MKKIIIVIALALCFILSGCASHGGSVNKSETFSLDRTDNMFTIDTHKQTILKGLIEMQERYLFKGKRLDATIGQCTGLPDKINTNPKLKAI